MYLVYGQPSAFSILPCASASKLGIRAECAAAAVQLMANGSIADASFRLTVKDVSVNVTARYEEGGVNLTTRSEELGVDGFRVLFQKSSFISSICPSSPPYLPHTPILS